MTRVPPLVLGWLAVVFLAGCGQSNPELIPQANADTLQQTADNIQAACEADDRSEARAQIRLALREIDALPRTVDSELKQNLEAWIEQIRERIPRDCRAEATPTPEADRDGRADRDRRAHGDGDRGADGDGDRGAHRGPDRAPTATAPPETTPEGDGVGGGTEFEDGQE